MGTYVIGQVLTAPATITVTPLTPSTHFLTLVHWASVHFVSLAGYHWIFFYKTKSGLPFLVLLLHFEGEVDLLSVSTGEQLEGCQARNHFR